MPKLSAPQRWRITSATSLLMVAAAAFTDGAQLFSKALHFIPAIGNITAVLFGISVSLGAGLSYWFWFRLHDVGFFDRIFAKGFVWAGNFIIELIPIINGLWPGWTIAVLVTIWLVRKEDRQYNEDMQRQLQQQAAARARESRAATERTRARRGGRPAA